MVFAGYGITAPELKYDDFARFETKGKIAVVLSKFPGGTKQTPWDFYSQKDYDEPLEKALNAQKAGASGIIVILPSNEGSPAELSKLQECQELSDQRSGRPPYSCGVCVLPDGRKAYSSQPEFGAHTAGLAGQRSIPD